MRSCILHSLCQCVLVSVRPCQILMRDGGGGGGQILRPSAFYYFLFHHN